MNTQTQIMDKFSRVLAVHDQLSFKGNPSDLKSIVGRIAVSLRDGRPLHMAESYAVSMRGTFKEESYEWAVLGCVLNIIRGELIIKPHGLN